MGLWSFLTDNSREQAKRAAVVEKWLNRVESPDTDFETPQYFDAEYFDYLDYSEEVSESPEVAPLPPPMKRNFDIGAVSYSNWQDPYKSSLRAQPASNTFKPNYSAQPAQNAQPATSYQRVLKPLPYQLFAHPGSAQEPSEDEDEESDEESDEEIVGESSGSLASTTAGSASEPLPPPPPPPPAAPVENPPAPSPLPVPAVDNESAPAEGEIPAPSQVAESVPAPPPPSAPPIAAEEAPVEPVKDESPPPPDPPPVETSPQHEEDSDSAEDPPSPLGLPKTNESVSLATSPTCSDTEEVVPEAKAAPEVEAKAIPEAEKVLETKVVSEAEAKAVLEADPVLETQSKKPLQEPSNQSEEGEPVPEVQDELIVEAPQETEPDDAALTSEDKPSEELANEENVIPSEEQSAVGKNLQTDDAPSPTIPETEKLSDEEIPIADVPPAVEVPTEQAASADDAPPTSEQSEQLADEETSHGDTAPGVPLPMEMETSVIEAPPLTPSIEPDIPTELETPIEPEIAIEPEISIEPVITVQPEIPVEPMIPVEPEIPVEPDISDEPETSPEPEIHIRSSSPSSEVSIPQEPEISTPGSGSPIDVPTAPITAVEEPIAIEASNEEVEAEAEIPEAPASPSVTKSVAFDPSVQDPKGGKLGKKDKKSVKAKVAKLKAKEDEKKAKEDAKKEKERLKRKQEEKDRGETRRVTRDDKGRIVLTVEKRGAPEKTDDSKSGKASKSPKKDRNERKKTAAEEKKEKKEEKKLKSALKGGKASFEKDEIVDQLVDDGATKEIVEVAAKDDASAPIDDPQVDAVPTTEDAAAEASSEIPGVVELATNASIDPAPENAGDNELPGEICPSPVPSDTAPADQLPVVDDEIGKVTSDIAPMLGATIALLAAEATSTQEAKDNAAVVTPESISTEGAKVDSDPLPTPLSVDNPPDESPTASNSEKPPEPEEPVVGADIPDNKDGAVDASGIHESSTEAILPVARPVEGGSQPDAAILGAPEPPIELLTEPTADKAEEDPLEEEHLAVIETSAQEEIASTDNTSIEPDVEITEHITNVEANESNPPTQESGPGIFTELATQETKEDVEPSGDTPTPPEEVVVHELTVKGSQETIDDVEPSDMDVSGSADANAGDEEKSLDIDQMLPEEGMIKESDTAEAAQSELLVEPILPSSDTIADILVDEAQFTKLPETQEVCVAQIEPKEEPPFLMEDKNGTEGAFPDAGISSNGLEVSSLTPAMEAEEEDLAEADLPAEITTSASDGTGLPGVILVHAEEQTSAKDQAPIDQKEQPPNDPLTATAHDPFSATIKIDDGYDTAEVSARSDFGVEDEPQSKTIAPDDVMHEDNAEGAAQDESENTSAALPNEEIIPEDISTLKTEEMSESTEEPSETPSSEQPSESSTSTVGVVSNEPEQDVKDILVQGRIEETPTAAEERTVDADETAVDEDESPPSALEDAQEPEAHEDTIAEVVEQVVETADLPAGSESEEVASEAVVEEQALAADEDEVKTEDITPIVENITLPAEEVPLAEGKSTPAEEVLPVGESDTVGDTTPGEEGSSVLEESAPVEETVIAEESAPVEESAPAEENAPTGANVPTEESSSAEVAAPLKETEEHTSPISEAPVAEEPVAEEPVAGEPVTEEPVVEESVAEEPVAEEPVAEESVAEESVAEEPVAEEPIAEEPIAEEPIAEEPIAEEPVAEEPVAEESVAEEPVAEESVADEPVADKLVAELVAVEPIFEDKGVSGQEDSLPVQSVPEGDGPEVEQNPAEDGGMIPEEALAAGAESTAVPEHIASRTDEKVDVDDAEEAKDIVPPEIPSSPEIEKAERRRRRHSYSSREPAPISPISVAKKRESAEVPSMWASLLRGGAGTRNKDRDRERIRVRSGSGPSQPKLRIATEEEIRKQRQEARRAERKKGEMDEGEKRRSGGEPIKPKSQDDEARRKRPEEKRSSRRVEPERRTPEKGKGKATGSEVELGKSRRSREPNFEGTPDALLEEPESAADEERRRRRKERAEREAARRAAEEEDEVKDREANAAKLKALDAMEAREAKATETPVKLKDVGRRHTTDRGVRKNDTLVTPKPGLIRSLTSSTPSKNRNSFFGGLLNTPKRDPSPPRKRSSKREDPKSERSRRHAPRTPSEEEAHQRKRSERRRERALNDLEGRSGRRNREEQPAPPSPPTAEELTSIVEAPLPLHVSAPAEGGVEGAPVTPERRDRPKSRRVDTERSSHRRSRGVDGERPRASRTESDRPKTSRKDDRRERSRERETPRSGRSKEKVPVAKLGLFSGLKRALVS